MMKMNGRRETARIAQTWQKRDSPRTRARHRPPGSLGAGLLIPPKPRFEARGQDHVASAEPVLHNGVTHWAGWPFRVLVRNGPRRCPSDSRRQTYENDRFVDPGAGHHPAVGRGSGEWG